MTLSVTLPVCASFTVVGLDPCCSHLVHTSTALTMRWPRWSCALPQASLRSRQPRSLACALVVLASQWRRRLYTDTDLFGASLAARCPTGQHVVLHLNPHCGLLPHAFTVLTSCVLIGHYTAKGLYKASSKPCRPDGIENINEIS